MKILKPFHLLFAELTVWCHVLVKEINGLKE